MRRPSAEEEGSAEVCGYLTTAPIFHLHAPGQEEVEKS